MEKSLDIPKISVRIITYNQEVLIKRAINSLLAQKEYIYEICVSDDCSTDHTWEVLLDYSIQYPGLFKLNRNNPNKGIFENIEKSWEMPAGDIVYGLAGDDECGQGWFKQVVDFIQSNNIDYKNELFCIYGDYKCLYPNGDYFIHKNKQIMSEIHPLRLSFRGLLGNRGACYSIKVLKKFRNVSMGRSYIPEAAQDRQLQLFAEHNYYIPYVGNIYYTQIGVNVRFSKSILEQQEKVEGYARDFMESQGYHFCKKDLHHTNYLIEVSKNYRDKTIKHRLEVIRQYILGIDMVFGMRQFFLKRYLFAIFRRLPHFRPLQWDI